jgi:hypothetical protein
VTNLDTLIFGRNKFLIGVFHQLDCLLALVDTGMPVPDDILDIMCEIMRQDEANKKAYGNGDESLLLSL